MAGPNWAEQVTAIATAIGALGTPRRAWRSCVCGPASQGSEEGSGVSDCS